MIDYFRFVANKATEALLAELETSPKYGLVCPDTCGSHADMDYSVMKCGIEAISPFFEEFAKVGYNFREEAGKDLLDLAKIIGQKGEKALLNATKGINTHKGALFCMGLFCVAAGYLAGKGMKITPKRLGGTVALLCKGLCQRELKSDVKVSPYFVNKQDDFCTVSHGQKMFELYGTTGARGLAEQGFVSVTGTYLTILVKSYRKFDANTAQSKLLAYIISTTEDTNILYRSNDLTLKVAQNKCRGLYNRYTIDRAKKINEWFVSKNISAGGSADLLSLTIFVYKLCVESSTERDTLIAALSKA